MAGTSRRPHVVMSQRRDVGSTNIKVNKRQRRDVSTSRRLNISTSQRRDVSASFVFSTLKEKKGCIILGIRNCTNEGAEIRAAATLSKEGEPMICIFLFLLDNSIDVLPITY